MNNYLTEQERYERLSEYGEPENRSDQKRLHELAKRSTNSEARRIAEYEKIMRGE